MVCKTHKHGIHTTSARNSRHTTQHRHISTNRTTATHTHTMSILNYGRCPTCCTFAARPTPMPPPTKSQYAKPLTCTHEAGARILSEYTWARCCCALLCRRLHCNKQTRPPFGQVNCGWLGRTFQIFNTALTQNEGEFGLGKYFTNHHHTSCLYHIPPATGCVQFLLYFSMYYVIQSVVEHTHIFA